jgi:hypothetical protein
MRLRFLLLGLVVLAVGMREASAAIQFDILATFKETHPTNSATSGPDAPNQWTVSAAGAPEGFYITQLTWTMPSVPSGATSKVIYDTTDGGAGHGESDAFNYFSGNTVSGAPTVSDGGSQLAMSFANWAFASGDTLAYTVDVDNSNVTVRGYYEPGGHGAIGGKSKNPDEVANPTNIRARLDVTYFNGVVLDTAHTYFYGTGLNQDAGTAEAKLHLTYVPEPASVVVWSLLGLVCVAIARRARR